MKIVLNVFLHILYLAPIFDIHQLFIKMAKLCKEIDKTLLKTIPNPKGKHTK